MNEAFCPRFSASLHKLSKHPSCPLTAESGRTHGAEGRTSELMAPAQHERALRHPMHWCCQIIKCFLILQNNQEALRQALWIRVHIWGRGMLSKDYRCK